MRRVLVLLLNLFTICHLGKPLDKTPLLQYLDDDIVRDLTDPIEGRSQTLIENVEKYNNLMGNVIDMIQQNVYEAYIKAVELQKIGGPQFLKINIDKNLVKKVYKWLDADIIKLQERFDISKQKWELVQAEFKSAGAIFKRIQEEDAKEKGEQAESEKKRVEELRKAEEEFSKKVTVNLGAMDPI